YGRARHRGREDGADAAPLRPRRPARDGRAPRRLRPPGPREPAQDLPRREGVRGDARAATPGGPVTTWADILGPAYVRAGTAPDPVDGVVPPWVVSPGDVSEVRACVAAGARLVAAGLGAHLDIGAPPAGIDVLLRLDRLGRVLDHQAGDMTVT